MLTLTIDTAGSGEYCLSRVFLCIPHGFQTSYCTKSSRIPLGKQWPYDVAYGDWLRRDTCSDAWVFYFSYEDALWSVYLLLLLYGNLISTVDVVRYIHILQNDEHACFPSARTSQFTGTYAAYVSPSMERSYSYSLTNSFVGRNGRLCFCPSFSQRTIAPKM